FYVFCEDKQGGATHIRCYSSTTFDSQSWTDEGDVLEDSPSGWDSWGVSSPVVWKEGATWHMLYEGSDTDWSTAEIGHATSSSPTSGWSKDGANPIFEPSDSVYFSGTAVVPDDIIVESDAYLICFHGKNSAGDYLSGLAKGTSGGSPSIYNWVENTHTPIFTDADNYGGVDGFAVHPQIIKEDGTYKFFYYRADDTTGIYRGYGLEGSTDVTDGIKDVSGTGNHGRNISSNTSVHMEDLVKSGHLGWSLDFPASNDSRLEIPYHNSLRLTDMTVQAWVNSDTDPEAASTDEYIVTRGDQNYGLFWDHSNDNFEKSFSFATAWPQCGISDNLNTSTWYFITGTYDVYTATANIWLGDNGTIAVKDTVSSISPDPDDSSTTDILTIGGSDSNGLEFTGRIGEIRLSKIARDSDWVEADYRIAYAPGTYVIEQSAEATSSSSSSQSSSSSSSSSSSESSISGSISSSNSSESSSSSSSSESSFSSSQSSFSSSQSSSSSSSSSSSESSISISSSSSQSYEPYEDFDTFTEVDPVGDKITIVDKTSITFSDLARDDNAYVYKTPDPYGYSFDADFTIDFDLKVTGQIGEGQLYIAMLGRSSDGIGTAKDHNDNSWSSLNVFLKYFNDTAGIGYHAFLHENDAGTWYESLSGSNGIDLSQDTQYYCRLWRDDDEGANGTLHLGIYTDSARTTHANKSPHSLALNSAKDYDTLYVVNTWDSGSGSSLSGNLDNFLVLYALPPSSSSSSSSESSSSSQSGLSISSSSSSSSQSSSSSESSYSSSQSSSSSSSSSSSESSSSSSSSQSSSSSESSSSSQSSYSSSQSSSSSSSSESSISISSSSSSSSKSSYSSSQSSSSSSSSESSSSESSSSQSSSSSSSSESSSSQSSSSSSSSESSYSSSISSSSSSSSESSYSSSESSSSSSSSQSSESSISISQSSSSSSSSESSSSSQSSSSTESPSSSSESSYSSSISS
ncbi:MAG: LamG-like jellyroll fold domain-containing protein, partial [Candidatus Thorarchaeota archaeon]